MKKTLKLLDVCAGVGGFHLGFNSACKQLGITPSCVGAIEFNKYARMTYNHNFPDTNLLTNSKYYNSHENFVPGNITQINTSKIPQHDILTGGFPCQSFSIAGKKLGFEDTRGTLFFDIANLIANKRPSVFVLENVKGLVGHNKGQTIKTILHVLRHELKYHVVEPQVLNSKNFGVAQNRPRVIIVGFRNKQYANNFQYPKGNKKVISIKNILESNVDVKYYLSQKYWNTLQKHKARHAGKGNGFGYNILSKQDISNTLVIGGMGKERNLFIDKNSISLSKLRRINNNNKKPINNDRVRVLTPREWARLQGFPEDFVFPVSNTQIYRQMGNAVTVNVISDVIKEIISACNYRI